MHLQEIPELMISIHAPLAGCDSLIDEDGCITDISIHAPLAGCDAGDTAEVVAVRNFNPRTPRGVRR